jgi:Mlc titration factor MtfA (ptsG expression regulator)
MWIEIDKNKSIVAAHSEEPSKSNYTLVEVEDNNFDCIGKWWTKAKGIHVPVLTKTQLSEKEKLDASNTAKRFLRDTDFVAMKLSEVHDDTVAYTALKEKYADILAKRAASRLLVV